MPYELELEKQLQNLWKVKIFDKECLEPPHVTIIRSGKIEKWRWDLRKKTFMDKQPSPQDLPKALVKTLKDEKNYAEFVKAWNKMFKHNPVESSEIKENVRTIKVTKPRKKKKK